MRHPYATGEPINFSGFGQQESHVSLDVLKFNGSESAEDVLSLALAEFKERTRTQFPHVSVVYQNNIPFFRYESAIPTEFVCLYRLDTMLLPFFAEAERIYDAVATPVGVDKELRNPLIRYLACFGMLSMLGRLMILQRQLFEDNFEEGKLATSTFLVQSIVAASDTTKNSALRRSISRQVKSWLDQVVEKSTKKKRDFLVGFANRQPLLKIPTKAGRPLGATKSEEKKAHDKAQFVSKLEETIKTLYHTLGRAPFKYEVAEALNVGGRSAKGSDSRINSLNNKLMRLAIDYTALIDRLNLHE